MFKSDPPYLTRRGMIVTGLAAGGGLAIAYTSNYLDDGSSTAKFGRTTPDATALNGWIKITPDNRVIMAVARAEMGQGITTSLPMILAEEMDADWDTVDFELAPLDKDYYSVGFMLRILDAPKEDMTLTQAMTFWGMDKVFGVLGLNITGGSTSIVDGMYGLRPIGAAARAMLVKAAADRFDVPERELTVAKSVVSHAASGQFATFGELADAAAKVSPPSDPQLKDPSAYTIIGTSKARLDIPAKTEGKAAFGIDTRRPGQVFAAVKQAPQFGATVGGFSSAEAEGMPGVIAVVKASESAVAVIAETTWQAYQALDAVDVTWANAPEPFSSVSLFEEYEASFDRDDPENPIPRMQDDGDVDSVFSGPDVIEATYRVPYLAHATMEPMNTTALYQDGPDGPKLELWSPTQSTTVTGWAASRAAGEDINAEHIDVHATLMGGGFGRRSGADYTEQAVRIAMAVPGRPVQMLWRREEDIQHDQYRPLFAARFRAALGQNGLPDGWHNVLVGQSVTADFNKSTLGFGGDGTEDAGSTTGAKDLPYKIPNVRVSYVNKVKPVPIGYWRSVANSITGFLTESFMDELARAAGRDPVDYRRALLADSPKELAVLNELAARANWGEALRPDPDGGKRGRGIAIHTSYGSIVGQVIDVTVRGGEVFVDRVVCVCDPRQVVHPDSLVAQMEGSIIMGLSSALYEEIVIENGAVAQSNFHDYEVLKMRDVPEIEVHLMPQGGLHGGGGEPGLPPVAPALTNAIFDATGVRIRELPVIKTPLVGV